MTDNAARAREKPRMPPRRAALLIAAIAGVSAGAMGFVLLVIWRYWPDAWGGYAVALLLILPVGALMLMLQMALLRSLFRWSGLRLLAMLDSFDPNSSRDAGLGMLMVLIGMLSVSAVVVGLSFLLPAEAGEDSSSMFIYAFLPYLFLVQKAAIWASAEAFPDQAPEESEETRAYEAPPAIGTVRLWLAGYANLLLAAPPMVWAATIFLDSTAAPVAGALLGATIGTATCIGAGVGRDRATWPLLIAALFAADLAAAAVSLPAAWALAAYGLAGSDWLPALVMLVTGIGMTALTGATAEGLMRRRAAMTSGGIGADGA